MNKEKFSTILEQYSNYLKRYGVYLLIILFILLVSLNYFLGKETEPNIENEPDIIPVADVTVEDSVPPVDGQETSVLENPDHSHQTELSKTTETPITELEAVPVEPPIEKVAEAVTDETTKSTNDANVAKEETEASRPLAHSPTRPLTLIWPMEGEVSKKYGLSYWEVYGDYRIYPGIDIEVNSNAGVSAAGQGKVILVEKIGENYVVEIDHGQDCLTHYSQLSQVQVKEGQTVKVGQNIGQAGSYLHFRIKKNGRWVDPLENLSG